MDPKFPLTDILPDTVTCVTRERLISTKSNPYAEHLSEIIDRMGEYSAAAQMLPQIVTSANKLRNSDHHLFILSDHDCNKVLGILKTGRKRLFLHDERGDCREIEPLCVLDFYIHASHQRRGHGKSLFNHMLQAYQAEPSSLAIDSPSTKMLQFLKKHYRLDRPIFGANNFVTFPGFFNKNARELHGFRRIPYNLERSKTREPCQFDRLLASTEKNKSELDSPYELSRSIRKIMEEEQNAVERQPPQSGNLPRNRDFCIDPLESTSDLAQSDVLKVAPKRPNYQCSGTSVSKKIPSQSRDSNLKNSVFPAPDIARREIGDHSVINRQQLESIRNIATSRRAPRGYSYLNAVRNHNGHQRLW